jgi:trans-2,3-dihydro-3-hydroxyanthranilate isomerase
VTVPTYTFYQLDVFTREPLAGNPLAVFPEAAGLDPRTMQALAREMNLSETTFVTASPAATRRVRFFTPAAEIPLAGHPTIGTWWLLTELGQLGVAGMPRDGSVRVTQETGRGVLSVDITLASGAPAEVTMTQARPEFGPVVEDRARLAAALGGGRALLADRPAPQVVSTALPQLMVPIRSRAQLSALPSGGAGAELAALLKTMATDCAMLFVLDEGGAPDTVWCRMFAPGLGVTEDPATGSAAGALGAYLVRHGLAGPRDGTARIVVNQGLEIGRPSVMQVTVRAGAAGDVMDVRVGGAAVRVIEGVVRL